MCTRGYENGMGRSGTRMWCAQTPSSSCFLFRHQPRVRLACRWSRAFHAGSVTGEMDLARKASPFRSTYCRCCKKSCPLLWLVSANENNLIVPQFMSLARKITPGTRLAPQSHLLLEDLARQQRENIKFSSKMKEPKAPVPAHPSRHSFIAPCGEVVCFSHAVFCCAECPRAVSCTVRRTPSIY